MNATKTDIAVKSILGLFSHFFALTIGFPEIIFNPMIPNSRILCFADSFSFSEVPFRLKKFFICNQRRTHQAQGRTNSLCESHDSARGEPRRGNFRMGEMRIKGFSVFGKKGMDRFLGKGEAS